jgi:sec-independent protein translocase protein TatC
VARVRRVEPDEQLTLVEHLDELRSRIVVVLAVLAVGMTLCFWQSGQILEYLRTPLPPEVRDKQFLMTGPLDAILISISISIYGGLLLALPVLSYQFYAFVVPAFAEEHHRFIKPMEMMIPFLFIAGALFGWYFVVPPALSFLFSWNADQFNAILKARDYIQFIALTLIAMGIVFELPVVMLLLARLRLVSSALMRKHWRVSIVGLAVLAMLLPGVDPISFIVEFIPLLVLYGFSYFLVVLVERGRKDEADVDASLT